MPGLLLGENVGERLLRFPQAHVIREDSVQPVAGEELHPVKSRELIVAQGRLKATRRRHRIDPGKILQLRGQLREVRWRIDPQPAESRERCGVERVEPRLVGELRIDQR